MMLTLRQRGELLDDPVIRDRPADDTGGPRIRCPRCAWEPSRHDAWACSCLHVWNTFETGGVCPACGRQWQETQCPKCDAWSPHLAWYVEEAGPGQ
jgi:hypothetical protein